MRLKLIFLLSIVTVLILAIKINVTNGNTLNLKGRILLQVESRGEAWYINPRDGKRYYVKNGEAAFKLMKDMGVGIKNDGLKKIPIANFNFEEMKDTDMDRLPDTIEESLGTDKNIIDSDNDGYSDYLEVIKNYNPLGSGLLVYDFNFAREHAGEIFLQIENKGEAWYINPVDNKRYFLGSPNDAYNLIRKLGLGISNKNLEKIPFFSSADDQRLVDIRKIRTALEMYYDQNQVYPENSGVLGSKDFACFTFKGFKNTTDCKGTIMMDLVPQDPLSANGFEYFYTAIDNGKSYSLKYKMESGGVFNATPSSIR